MNRLQQLFRPQKMMTADVQDITDLDTPLGRQVVAIYERSFPEKERDPVEAIADSLQNANLDSEVVHLRALVEQERVVGFTYFSSYKDYYLGFLKFIAVHEDVRGNGYGPLLLQDARQQVRADGVRLSGWPYLGLVFEVERPEMAENDQDRQIRERRIRFYLRNGAAKINGVDYIAPPVAPGQPGLPFHLMILRAVPKLMMQRWLRKEAVRALLIEGYGQDHNSWFLKHALGMYQQAHQYSSG